MFSSRFCATKIGIGAMFLCWSFSCIWNLYLRLVLRCNRKYAIWSNKPRISWTFIRLFIYFFGGGGGSKDKKTTFRILVPISHFVDLLDEKIDELLFPKIFSRKTKNLMVKNDGIITEFTQIQGKKFLNISCLLNVLE